MTAEQQLERSVLESKERDELHAIAQALSVKTNTRTKKADIIDGILKATGVAVDGVSSEAPVARAPRGGRSRPVTTDNGSADDAPATNGDHADPVSTPGSSRRPAVQSFGPADDAATTDVSTELDYDFDDIPGASSTASAGTDSPSADTDTDTDTDAGTGADAGTDPHASLSASISTIAGTSTAGVFG
jgi:hypothetical protein